MEIVRSRNLQSFCEALEYQMGEGGGELKVIHREGQGERRRCSDAMWDHSAPGQIGLCT